MKGGVKRCGDEAFSQSCMEMPSNSFDTSSRDAHHTVACYGSVFKKRTMFGTLKLLLNAGQSLKAHGIRTMTYKSMCSSKKRATKRRLLETYGPYCHWCGTELEEWELTIEHLKPLSKGGSNNIKNLRLACHQCNWSRGNHDEWSYHPREGRFY